MRFVSFVLRQERGQVLLLTALLATAFLGFVGLVVDAGLWYVERRQVQNAADEATLAAAHELRYGGTLGDATAAALENAAANGYNNDGVTSRVTVHIPPTSGDYVGNPNAIEVVIDDLDVPTFFIHVLTSPSGHLQARGVARVSGGGTGSPPGPPLPVPLPSIPCDDNQAVVDGRALPSEDYTQVADLVGTDGTDYGDAFFACDGPFYYFALVLNGPSTGGQVSNDNVYYPRAGRNGNPPDYHAIYQTGWRRHDFPALRNSDRARFQISCDATPVHDFVQDYLRPEGSSWASDTSGEGSILVQGPNQSASSLEWNLENPTLTGWGDDPGEDPLTSSPPFDPTYGSWDPQYNGWVWEVIYEFRVPVASYDGCNQVTFGLHNFNGQAGPQEGIHSSPSKQGDDSSTLQVMPFDVRLVE